MDTVPTWKVSVPGSKTMIEERGRFITDIVGLEKN